mmetsp:Transcript_39970/g.76450  ORF Transcript_39970/g.76450 Transcript_39970/m.76450 type:complete len:403 (-) Transcript_39970:352-1560(-)
MTMPSQGPVVSSCEVASDHEDSAIAIPSFDQTTEDNRAICFDQTSSVVETEGNGECLTGHAPPEVFPPEHDKRLGKCIIRGCPRFSIAGTDCCLAHISSVGIWCHHEACMSLPAKGSVYCSAHLKDAHNEPCATTQATALHGRTASDARPKLSNARRLGKEQVEKPMDFSTAGGSPARKVRKPSCMDQQLGRNANRAKPKGSASRGGGPHCLVNGCLKMGQAGTQLCKAHGGGVRCLYPECLTSALWGGGPSKQFCAHHGGGKHCEHEGCEKFAQGRKSQFCVHHGGGDACQREGCPRKARGRTKFCRGHGGGSRCQWEGCATSAIHSNSGFCQAHGPKSCRACKHPGCDARAKGTGSHLCMDHGGGRRCQYGGGDCLRFVCLASMRRGGNLCKMHDKQVKG